MLPPGEFLLVFEQYGMMPDLDRRVVNRLVQRIARGSLKGFRHFSVNVARATLQDFCFPGHVTQTIKIGVIAKFVEEAASWRN
jgi:EAL domain-containing protein (putative c-di-GMP-specific phosphodiesterase class I)